METIIDFIFKLLVGALVLKELFMLFFKKTIQHFFDKLLKNHEKVIEQDLKLFQHRLDVTLESQRSILNIEQTQYSKLQERRVQIMDKMYKNIVRLDLAIRSLTQQLKPIPQGYTKEQLEEEEMKEAGEAYNNFLKFYLYHEIYFNEETCALVKTLKDHYWESWFEGTFRQRIGATDFRLNKDHANKASEIVETIIPPLKANLEKEFRKILGVK